MAWDPKFIVLDEPTVGQDFIEKERLLNLIIKLKEEGKGIVIASHDMEFLWKLRPRVVVMKKGKIVANSSAEETFYNFTLLKENNLLPPQLVELAKSLNLNKPFYTVEEAKNWILKYLV
ncbi:Cobalt import ATP-binding protein CbiO [archaeon HR06]|nr:Cobalt import ATP-binding protein CbiO [archaeon HR06]